MTPARIAGLGVAFAAACSFAATPLPNPSFEQGEQSPAGWQLQGKGSWQTSGHTGKRSVSVTGTGRDSSYWRTTNYRLEPNTLCRVSFWMKAERATGGCVISGPSFCNRDFRAQTGWQRRSFVFITPAEVGDAYLRFGQWHLATKVAFDDIELKPTEAVHEQFGGITLGEGEEIGGSRYTFSAPLGAQGANHSRPLHTFRCGFNSNRWCFHDGAEVIYRHAIPGHDQVAATIEANCNYHSSGSGFIDVSADGKTWTNVAKFDRVNRVRTDVSKKLLPAEAIFVRFRAAGKETDTRDSKPGDFQINEYRYAATLDADLGTLRGSTAYLDIQTTHPDFPVTILSLPSATGSGNWKIAISPRAGKQADLQIAASVTTEKREEQVSRISASAAALVSVGGGVGAPAAPTMQVAFSSPLRRAGTNILTLIITADGKEIYRASAQRHVASLHDASYGYLLPSDGPCQLWWCEGHHKVSRTRAVPTVKKPHIELAAARNEYEPFQLVLRPKADLRDLRVRLSPLKGKAAALAAENISVDEVAYVNVTRPTDSAGVRGWWPDPLPPFDQGADLEANRNHPLWITVYVPADQRAGQYDGSLDLAAEGWKASVPIRLRVWDFTLPKTTHLQTAFGLRTSAIRRYHNLETTDELRKVLDLYLKNFAAHRIAPYTPALLDPIKVAFSTGPWDGGSIDARDPKEGKRCLRIDDDNPKASVAASNTQAIPVDVTKRYRLSWWAKTAKANQPYLVTLQQYDADGKWVWGNNMDFRRTGTGKWQREEIPIPAPGARPLSPKAKFLRVTLRPAPWSEQGEHTGAAWFDDVRLQLATGGPNLVADGGFEHAARELKATLDFTAFDRACEKYLDGLGFNAILVRLRGLGGGTFHSRRYGRIGPFPQGTPEYEKLMASQGRQIVEHLRRKGWLSRAYIYWFDEPAPRDYEFVVEGMKLIKRAAPHLTRMLTEQPEPALYGHVDLWCPVLSNYDPAIGAERQKLGERFWWYLCCGPRAPYIGLFIDHPAVDLRVWAWLSRKWGIQGQLVWTSNYWTSSAAFPPPRIQNPWEDPMSYVSGYSYKPGQIGYWGNGDGRFLYPPNRDIKNDNRKYLEGPVNSIRWEMLREGIEDYEYFCLLDELIARAKKAGKAPDLVRAAERLALVPDAIITDGRTYSKDPQPLLTRRRKLAETIERLSRALR